MTRPPVLALAVLAAGLAGCTARPPNNTTAEGQAFYACDRPALNQTADVEDLIDQIRGRESLRGDCLASGAIPPLPGARFVEAPRRLPPLPVVQEAPPTPDSPPAVTLPQPASATPGVPNPRAANRGVQPLPPLPPPPLTPGTPNIPGIESQNYQPPPIVRQ
jgi:hypothetical protein